MTKMKKRNVFDLEEELWRRSKVEVSQEEAMLLIEKFELMNAKLEITVEDRKIFAKRGRK